MHVTKGDVTMAKPDGEQVQGQQPRVIPLLLGHRLTITAENKVDSNYDQSKDDQFRPPSVKKPLVDDDILRAEAVLAYAASLGKYDDAPKTY